MVLGNITLVNSISKVDRYIVDKMGQNWPPRSSQREPGQSVLRDLDISAIGGFKRGYIGFIGGYIGYRRTQRVPKGAHPVDVWAKYRYETFWICILYLIGHRISVLLQIIWGRTTKPQQFCLTCRVPKALMSWHNNKSYIVSTLFSAAEREGDMESNFLNDKYRDICNKRRIRHLP